MSNQQVRNLIIVALILAAAASRMIPHPYNFAPMSAMALFGAAHFGRKAWAFGIPLLATWLSDLFLNNVVYNHYQDGFVWLYDGWYWPYGTFALIALLGMITLRRITVPRIIGSSLGASAIFFLITNLACWPGNAMYAQDFGGLMACYAAGLPFLGGTVLGDFAYSGLLFGSFAVLQQRYPALRAAIA